VLGCHSVTRVATNQSCVQALDGPFCSRATGALPNEVASPSSVVPQGGPISVEAAGPPQPLRRIRSTSIPAVVDQSKVVLLMGVSSR
jgi:hypothetical protein